MHRNFSRGKNDKNDKRKGGSGNDGGKKTGGKKSTANEPTLDRGERLFFEIDVAGQTSGWFVGKEAKANLISLQ